MEVAHKQIATSALLAPWAITADGLALVRERATQALQSLPGVPIEGALRAKSRGGVAIIQLTGPLSKSHTWFSSFLGGTDYETILRDLGEAVASSEIKSIVLNVDSPGGMAFGCGELSAAIYEARGAGKRIVSYVSGMMCSAAYWIGSAAHEIVVDRSAMIGSIGVRSMLVDDSKFLEKMGIAVYDIVSEQSPHKVTDASKEADRARAISTMTSMAEVFIADVARNRAVPSERVKSKFGKGDVFIGRDAIDAGMADRIGSFESLLAELQAGNTTAAAPRASTKRKRKGAPVMSMSNEKCDGCDREMDDDDELYCSACHGSADAKALLAVTGAGSFAEALATVSAWKIASAEIGALRGRLAEQQAAADAAAFDAAITEAKGKQLLAPSDAHKRNMAALAFKGRPDAIVNLKSFLAALDPLVGPVTQSVIEPQSTSAAGAGITSEERRIAAKMNIPIEKLAANKARVMALASAELLEDVDNDEDAA